MTLFMEVIQYLEQFVELPDYQDSDARNKIIKSQLNTSLKLLIWTLIEEIKPVVTEKHNFKHRNDSMLKAWFETFTLPCFRYTDQDTLFIAVFHHK